MANLPVERPAAGPFQGLRVVGMGRFIAVPYCALQRSGLASALQVLCDGLPES